MSAALYLVRHAVAEERGTWAGPDELRPLTWTGWRQALALGERMGALGASSFRASPTVRCRDTLVPWAHSLGLEVGDDPQLFEDGEPSGRAEALQLLDRLVGVPEGTVVACTHGNLLLPLLAALDQGGSPRCPKGGVWRVNPAPGGGPRGPAVYLGRLDPQALGWKA